MTQAVEECADPEAQTTWEVTDTELVLHKGVTGRTIDTAALIDALEERLGQSVSGTDADAAPIEAQVTTAPPADPDFDAIRDEIAVEPADAYLDKETREVVPSVTGVDFDTEAAKAALDASDEGGTVGVPSPLPSPASPPPIWKTTCSRTCWAPAPPPAPARPTAGSTSTWPPTG